jgi:heptosyltransferase III
MICGNLAVCNDKNIGACVKLRDPLFWSTYRPQSPDWGAVESIICYQGKNLGDVLVSLPLIHRLKSLMPHAVIRCLVQPAASDILATSGVSTYASPTSAIEAISLGWQLRRQSPQLFIDLHGSLESELVARFCGASISIQVIGCKSRGIGRYTHQIPHRKAIKRHRIELNLDILRHLGADVAAEDARLDCSALARKGRDSEQIQKLMAGQPYIIIHPTSRWLFKTPAPSFWCEFINMLSMETDWRIFLTGLNQGLEGEFLAHLEHKTQAVSLSGALSVAELAALIDEAQGYLGVDTFASHIASGLGKPGLVLFGPSDELAWGPLLSTTMEPVVNEAYPCRPCNLDGCAGSKRSDCLNSLSPGRLVRRFLECME